MITYAGVPLLLEDPGGAAKRHIRRYIDERMASIFTPNLTAYVESRQQARANNGEVMIQQVGIPVPNYQELPKPQINTLYWPMGATRWSYGLFLVSGDTLNAIVSSMTSSGGLQLNAPQEFRMSTPDQTGEGVVTSLYMLPPRAVSPTNVPAGYRLWIVPLVDSRYFWQWKNVLFMNPFTWSDILVAIQTALGVTITADAVSANYQYPDQIEWKRDFENAAILLDALAHTVGMRFVKDWYSNLPTTSDCRLVTGTTAESDYLAMKTSTLTTNAHISGDDLSIISSASQMPGQVFVTFRNKTKTAVYDAFYADCPVTPFDPSQTKIFHCGAISEGVVSATRVGITGTEVPFGLTTQIATDYYKWQTRKYDYTFGGIAPWRPSGFDDCIIWEYAVPKGKKRVIQTRIQSMPYNFGVTNLPISFNATSSSSSSLSSASSSSPSSSSQSQSSGSSGSGSSGSSSSVTGCGCVSVVTLVQCTPEGGLLVQNGTAAQCCPGAYVYRGVPYGREVVFLNAAPWVGYILY